MSGIYRLNNTTNNHCYIGSAVNLAKRKIKHFIELNKNKHPNAYLQNAFNLRGEQSFVFNILEYCSKDELIE